MIIENVGLALSSLKANKMRALLTMLGIIIGIMSIIAIMTIGDAMTSSVSGSFSSLGASNITLSVQQKDEEANPAAAMEARMNGGQTASSSTSKQPTTDDLITDAMIDDLLTNFAGQVTGASVTYSAGAAQAKDGERYANVAISGVNQDYTKANSVTLLSGSFISEGDVNAKATTAVVSDKFVKNLFGDGANPIGQTVKVYKPTTIELYTIVGVYKYEAMGFGGTASDKELSTTFYVPVTTAKLDLLEKNYSSVTIIGAESGDIGALTDKLQTYFNNLYQNNVDWKVSVTNMTSMLDTITSTLNTLSIAIAFIAGISLLVGGIGVMNIMLVSVTERTREIGTRKALGAKNHHIQLQFVTEAVIISAIGGIIGLILGIAIGTLAASVFGVSAAISPVTVLGSVAFSMIVGVFFGLYPANRAAKLNPIDALRYE